MQQRQGSVEVERRWGRLKAHAVAALAILEGVVREACLSTELPQLQAAKEITLRDVLLGGSSAAGKEGMPRNGASSRSAQPSALGAPLRAASCWDRSWLWHDRFRPCREVRISVDGPPCDGIPLDSVAVSGERLLLSAEWSALSGALASTQPEEAHAGVQWLCELMVAGAELRLQSQQGASQTLS